MSAYSFTRRLRERKGRPVPRPLPEEEPTGSYYTTSEGLSVPACMAGYGQSHPAEREEDGSLPVPAWVIPLLTAALIVRAVVLGMPR